LRYEPQRSFETDKNAIVHRVAPPMDATGNDPPATVIIMVVAAAVRFAD
jgi:hypothetical protein